MISAPLHASPEAQGSGKATQALAMPRISTGAPCGHPRQGVRPIPSAKSFHKGQTLGFADRQGSQGNDFNEHDLGGGASVTVDEGLADLAVLANGKVLGGLEAARLMSPLRAIVIEGDDSMGIRQCSSSGDAGFDESVHGQVLGFGNPDIGHNVRISNTENQLLPSKAELFRLHQSKRPEHDL